MQVVELGKQRKEIEMKFDIGVFGGTREQYDDYIKNGVTIGHFIEVDDGSLTINMEDCIEYLQATMRLADNVTLAGEGSRTMIVSTGESTCSMSFNDIHYLDVNKPVTIDKSKPQDPQHFYRNKICK